MCKVNQNGQKPCRIFFVPLHSEMNDAENTIETLKRLVCEGAGVTAHTPGDFYAIAAYVEGRTHEGIGLTTVKRLWQYGGLSSKPRQATLDVLARAVGYRSYDDFREHYGDCSPSSDIVLGANIKNSDLAPGDRLMLRWNPGREVTAEYLGNSTFRIVSSVASKLAVGDTFFAHNRKKAYLCICQLPHGQPPRAVAYICKTRS